MCGIFAYVGKRNDAGKIVLDGLKRLEYRGYDSWGIAVRGNVDGKQVKFTVKKRVGKIGNALADGLPNSAFSLGHTRWATHGAVTRANAHPHLDCTGGIALVHNGIIENYAELRQGLLLSKHQFVSETDSEVAAHAIEELVKSLPFVEAVRRTHRRLVGLNALIATHPQENIMAGVRNGSPLVVGLGNGENFLASDPAALLPHTRTVYFVKDDELVLIDERSLRVFDAMTGKEKSYHPRHLTWKSEQAEKGKYPHFMLKEIEEQPRVLTEIAETNGQSREKVRRMFVKHKEVYVVGCGTAAYAAIAAAYFLSKIAKRRMNWAIGSEFKYHLDFVGKDSVVLALSQSGETIDTLEAVKKAKQKGVRIMALVNVLGSSLYREAHEKILIGAGPEKAVASTKAFTGMLAHLILLSYGLIGKDKDGRLLIRRTAQATRRVLEQNAVRKIQSLARKLKQKEHIYVIGRGLSYPLSLETALKIKEISYIHAEGFAAGELKHGVIALVERGTPCIAFLPNDETYGENLSGAMEMKSRGSFIIGVSFKPHEVFDVFLPVPDVGIASIIPSVVVAQTLAYYLAVALGRDPDMPRNLAKSVTVK